MKTKFVFAVLSLIMLSFVAGCTTFEAAKHQYTMRGQILESTDEGLYLCIGSADGAKAGQEYKVYKFVRTPGVKSQPNYRKEKTGTIKITEIVDEHYAKAKILTGEAKENYIVELDR